MICFSSIHVLRSAMLICGCLLGFITSSVYATQVTLYANHDTMMFASGVNNGAGGAPGLLAGTNAQPSIRRSLVSFDVSSIPAGATIDSVQLRLVIGQIAGSGSGNVGFSHPTIGMYKLDVSWGEANTAASTSNNLGGIGQGTMAAVGDTTWHSRFYDATNPVNWAQDGGKSGVDYEATASSSLVQSDVSGDVSLWPATAALKSDVESWLADPSKNFGWMLINANESSAQTFRGFYSRDYNPPDLTTAQLQVFYPQLLISYTAVPEPSGIVLLCWPSDASCR